MTARKNQTDIKRKILTNTKTIAVVGLSSKNYRAGYYVPAYLQSQGYRIIPVNPHLKGMVLGEQPYDDLESISEPVDLVLFFRRSETIPPLLEKAIDIGADSIWMQLGIVNESAAEKAREAGLDVVMDACMMVEHRRLM